MRKYRTPYLGSTAPRDRAHDGHTEGISRQTLLPSAEPDFPATGTVRTAMDICIIEEVHSDRKTLTVRSLVRNYLAKNVQWTSQLLDPTTGNGSYGTPKKGMVGLYLNIEGEKFFFAGVGILDNRGTTGFSNNREEVPLGSYVIRSSLETKLLALPNLIRVQGAHFCQMLMKRVTKLLYFLFYQLKFQSLNGLLEWTNDLKRRTSMFVWQFRDRLPPRKTADGNKKKVEDTYEVKFEAGTLEKDPEHILRLNVGKALSPVDFVTTESIQVKKLRTLLTEQLEKKGISTFTDLQKEGNEDFAFAYEEFTEVQDLTRERLVESILGAASYTDTAIPDALNGLQQLFPAEDSIEDLQTGELAPVTEVNRDPQRGIVGLDDDLQAFIPANRVEVKVTAEGKPTIAKPLIVKARAATENEADDDINSKFRMRLTRAGDLEVYQPEGRIAWLLKELFQLILENGPLDIDSGDGIRIQARKGMLFLGFKEAGITLTQEGKVLISGREVAIEVWKDVEQTTVVAPEGLITNNGTKVVINPDAVVVETNADITLRAAGDVAIEAGTESQSARDTSTEALRAELLAASGVPAIEGTLVETEGETDEPASEPAQ